MPHPFPHRYESSLHWTGDRTANMLAAPRAPITGSAPPEFDGTDQHWSPEHLLLSSVQLCLMLTFVSVAQKARYEFLNYRSSAVGVVDKTPSGLAVTEIAVTVDLTLPSGADPQKGVELMSTAKKYCLVSNSVKSAITLETRTSIAS